MQAKDLLKGTRWIAVFCIGIGALLRCRRRVQVGETLALRREKHGEGSASTVLARITHVLFAPDDSGPAWLAGCEFERQAEIPA